MRFHHTFFFLTLMLLVAEVLIALFVNDSFVRPYLGDVLVVMLIHCFLRTFLKTDARIVSIVVLAFAFLVELLQYLDLITVLGWQHSRLARTVLGTSFSWADLLCYLVGWVLVLCAETLFTPEFNYHKKNS